MSAASYPCPQNHRSETADFCSVCGAELAAAAPGPVAPTAGACPQCATVPDSPRQVFCEVCGYNYRTGTSGIPPAPARSVPPAAEPPPAPPAPVAAAPPAESVRWEVTVEVDPKLYGTVNPDAPAGQPIQTFTLFDVESLLGRGGTDVRVQIPVRGDVGISRRQALLVRRADGTLTVRDVGSANGTQLNGKELVAGVDTPVTDGDAIAVGAWTRVTVHMVRR
jgi:hypothetical protein